MCRTQQGQAKYPEEQERPSDGVSFDGVFIFQTYGKGLPTVELFLRRWQGHLSRPLLGLRIQQVLGGHTPACVRGLSGDLVHFGLPSSALLYPQRSWFGELPFTNVWSRACAQSYIILSFFRWWQLTLTQQPVWLWLISGCPCPKDERIERNLAVHSRSFYKQRNCSYE